MPPSCVAVVLVTCNSSTFMTETLTSISEQVRAPDLRIAIDDYSSDATPDLVAAQGFRVQRATTTAHDTTTRIAQNFQQGLRTAVIAGADIVVLGDHDDIWHPDRIDHQERLLHEHPEVAMVASDGFLIDEHGAAVPGTIRSTFPVPEDFGTASLRRRLAYAARHSIATGGASAVRPAALPDWSVPPGWLHDRWWSLAALRADRFLFDPTPVIDYRLSAQQQVGLDPADQHDPRRWWATKFRDLRSSGARLRDASRLLRP